MIYEFLADGFEEIEAVTQVDFLRRCGLDVKTVSITDQKSVRGTHDVYFTADAVFCECDFGDAELLILPGGMPGTTNLMRYKPLEDLIIRQNAANKRIAAICAAPMVFGKLGLLKGKEAVCYPGLEENLVGAKVVDRNAVTDGNITTGRGPGASLDFALELVRVLLGEDKAAEIRKDAVYRH